MTPREKQARESLATSEVRLEALIQRKKAQKRTEEPMNINRIEQLVGEIVRAYGVQDTVELPRGFLAGIVSSKEKPAHAVLYDAKTADVYTTAVLMFHVATGWLDELADFLEARDASPVPEESEA